MMVKRVLYFKLKEGEDLLKTVEKVLEENEVDFCIIKGIGGLSKGKLGVFIPSEKRYKEVEIEGSEGIVEVASLLGNSIKGEDGKPHPHLHAVLSNGEKVVAGHVLEGCRIKPFIELFILEIENGDKVRNLFEHRWKTS